MPTTPTPTPTKVALVTGANKGIGFEVSRQIARTGITVLLGSRSADLGQKAAATLTAEGLDVRFLPIDITDQATIAAAAQTIATDFGHLDILVNNAGIIVPGDGPASTATFDALERTLRTNFLGSVAVAQAMLPLLRKAPSARIVNVSSGLGSLTLQSDHNHPSAATKYLAYSASKAALNMFTVHLAYELRDTSIKINSAEPGYTATDLNGHSGHQTIPEGAAETIRLALLPDDGPTGTSSDRFGPVPW
jgi:NAD(P)-dependent dehydrogenase (short-subunit alcohol dehydrogenase family)